MTILKTNATADTVCVPSRTVGLWLLAMCAMVLVMIVLGGITRLTHSGLSMVDWQPVTGWLPPLNAVEWQTVFDLYKDTPEYKKINFGMTVEGFKSIFWLEFFHRFWGRIIGVSFMVPFFYFLLKGKLEPGLAPKLMLMFLLGGAQGVLGWFMVKSGLIDQPNVSQYRLTAHLGLAILIYTYMFWVALGLLRDRVSGFPKDGKGLERLTAITVIWVCLTMLAGALVAGLDAGFTYNTFPLMDGKFFPEGLFQLSPIFLNFFENLTTVQFNHRVMAKVLMVLGALLWWQACRQITSNYARWPFDLFAALLIIQFGLGIATILLVVPLFLAVAHQAVAFLLLTTGLLALHRLRNAGLVHLSSPTILSPS